MPTMLPTSPATRTTSGLDHARIDAGRADRGGQIGVEADPLGVRRGVRIVLRLVDQDVRHALLALCATC
jgi:hypothetical protein